MIVAGDFNTKAIEWGMPLTNSHGRLLLETAARLDLKVANVRSLPTYRRPGYGFSIPDVTFVSADLMPRVSDWRVLETENCSDHQYIAFSMDRPPTRTNRMEGHSKRWNLQKLDVESFARKLAEAPDPSEGVLNDQAGRVKANRHATKVARLLERLCDKTMPRKGHRGSRPPVYWWTEEIADLRKQCHRARRRFSRARPGERKEALRAEVKLARKILKNALKESKRRCWQQLIDQVERDPWGTGYQLVTIKLYERRPPEVRDADLMRQIVDGLFLTHEQRAEAPDENNDAIEIIEFTEGELVRAVTSLMTGKARGTDGIPAEFVRRTVIFRPKSFFDLFNECLRCDTFCDEWKKVRLVLVTKNKGGDPDSPSSYRSSSLLDTMGKVFEFLIKPRLVESVREAGDLRDDQLMTSPSSCNN